MIGIEPPRDGGASAALHDAELEATSLGTQIAPHFVDLPVGEPSPVVRLHQVSYSFKAHEDTGRAVARALAVNPKLTPVEVIALVRETAELDVDDVVQEVHRAGHRREEGEGEERQRDPAVRAADERGRCAGRQEGCAHAPIQP